MSWLEEDGVSKREHLKKAAYNVFVPNLEALATLEAETELPKLGADVWAHFQSLHSRRQQGVDGPLKFGWTEIVDYQIATGARLDLWTQRVIFDLEDEFFTILYERRKVREAADIKKRKKK